MKMIVVLDPTPIGLAEPVNTAEGIVSQIFMQTAVIIQIVEDDRADDIAAHLKLTFPIMQVLTTEEPEFLKAKRLGNRKLYPKASKAKGKQKSATKSKSKA